NPFTISDLSANTSYDFYVRADCGANNTDVSDWAGPYQFTTAYGIPFTENFDSYLPLNWREGKAILTDDTDVNIMESMWEQEDYLNNPSGNQSAVLDIWGTYRQDWLITPLIDLGTEDCELQFNLGLTDIGNSNPPEAQGEDNKFAVIISPDGGETWSSLNTLQMWDNTTTPSFYDIPNTGETISLDLSSYSGTIMLAFYGESTINYSNEFSDLFVDDINIAQTVNIDEHKVSENINIYPNPTTGIIYFDFLNSEIKKISILDITGKVIIEKSVNSQTDNINFSNYANGLYLIKLQTDKESFTTKIIKK
ncbi:MAG: T9SS type A sorting domain-containing protein, partial [Bacteroidota bacterium]|nr:T9SS type A sorting domain-containing protein [Bacteroidota bacterium]